MFHVHPGRAFAALLASSVLWSAPALAQPVLRGPDFDFDGFHDTVIGAPHDGTGGLVYISAGAHSLVLSQDTAGVPGMSEPADAFGQSVTWGRFNSDDYDDLVVGVPGEDDGIGAIEVFLGGPTGIIPNSGQLIMRTTPNVDGFGVPGELFGWSVAAGPIGMGVHDDIVVGAPGEGEYVGGSVQVFPSGTNGIDLSLGSITTIGDGALNAEDGFGRTVAIGLFNCDDHVIAVGAPYRFVGGAQAAGSVFISPVPFEGSVEDDIVAWQEINQDSSGMSGLAETPDSFGLSLAVGDFNDDGCHDLAVGSPHEAIGGLGSAGMVHVIPGAEDRLDTTASVGLYQDVGSVNGNSEAGDQFGLSLAATTLTDDQAHELVVGVPGEDGVGFIQIFRSGASGIQQGNDLLWSQNSASIPGVSEPGDGFGHALAGGVSLVVVGAAFEDITFNGTAFNGAGTTAMLVFSDTPAITLSSAQTIDGATFNGTPTANSLFGHSLAPAQIR